MSGPLLDFDDVLVDPDIADMFSVLRRAERIDPSTGKTIIRTTETRSVLGVVCAAHGNDLERVPDFQAMSRYMSVVTNFPLRGPAPGFQADIVVWGGDSFVVRTLDPYPHFGEGFVQAIVESMDVTDVPVPMAGGPEFDQPAESAMVGAL